MIDSYSGNPQGVPIFDSDFNMSAAETQIALADFCDKLLADPEVRPQYSTCWMNEFRGWVESRGGGFQFPAPGDALPGLMRAFMEGAGTRFNKMVGFSTDRSQVQWVEFKVRTYVDKDLEGTKLDPIYRNWVVKFEALSSEMPHSVGTGFISAPQFVRMKVELAFISGTTQAILLSAALIALAIVIFTQNLVIMLLTAASILMTVACLLGSFVLWDWPFGAVEAISVSLVVGLSVDYALHLGHSYKHAGDNKPNGHTMSRVERSLIALQTIGPSIMAAAATTVFSMVVLMLCSTHLFVELGVIVATTLTVGILFSMGSFTAALMLVGPEGNTGDVVYMMKRCRAWLSGEPQRQELTQESEQRSTTYMMEMDDLYGSS